jgi:hypothetical protein
MASFAEFVNEINEREALNVTPTDPIIPDESEPIIPGCKMYSWPNGRKWHDPVVTFHPYGPALLTAVEIPLVPAPRNLVPPTPIVGEFFHGVENGMIISEGQVLESTPGCFKVQLFDWWTGTPTAQAYVPAILYEDVEDMRDAYESYKTDWSLYETHEELYDAYVRYVKEEAPWGTTEQFEMNRKLCMEAEKRFEVVTPSPAGQVLPPAPVKLPKVPPAPLGPAAFHGIMGDFVRLVEPQTEGDINALVVAFLTAFGCLFGRKPHHYVEDTRHGTNLFSVIVGESSKARKGTITGRVMNLLKLGDKEFHEKRVMKGLSSSEGLIYCIRDAREVPLPKDGDPEMDKQLLAQLAKDRDPGVTDKRLLVVESEFATVLAQGKRDGNTLSEAARNAWDAVGMGVLAKTNKDKCQEPHVSLIGNITVDELQRCLTQTERSNGFGNRILWVYARRSKVLPCPERVPEKDLQVIADRINAVVHFRMPGELKWGESAKSLWYAEYARLSAEGSGDSMVDALTARAEAQVLRMAMIYAVLDSSSLIERVHLEAALEVWRYCEDSVKFIFGGTTGNKLAEDILGLLLARPEGMTQTELNDAFNRKKSAALLKDALDILVRLGKVRSEERLSKTKPVAVWMAL